MWPVGLTLNMYALNISAKRKIAWLEKNNVMEKSRFFPTDLAFV